eukprot:s444_g52.t1
MADATNLRRRCEAAAGDDLGAQQSVQVAGCRLSSEDGWQRIAEAMRAGQAVAPLTAPAPAPRRWLWCLRMVVGDVLASFHRHFLLMTIKILKRLCMGQKLNVLFELFRNLLPNCSQLSMCCGLMMVAVINMVRKHLR